MKSKHVEHGDIRVGDIRVGDFVVYKAESGFNEGRPQTKRVASITITEYTAEEQARLGFPGNVTYSFTDGSLAGPFDSVKKKQPVQCRACGKTLLGETIDCPKCGTTFCGNCVPSGSLVARDGTCCHRYRVNSQ
ncbi:MAG: hypothetical protein Q8K86_09540 [Candidatus Nanopelagicaceae bacterium]|nr:hypothetical protein [Candidatus Nanopelagicaceae bacterium]